MDDKFRSRKFLLAQQFTIAGIYALGMGWIDQGSFIGLAATVLGLYGGANVLEKNR